MIARSFIIAVAASTFAWGAAVAQESKPEQKAEQKIPGIETKSVLENEQMKVSEMRFAPGAKTPSLSHANRFVYALTDGSLVFSPSGKTPYELTFKTGEALWLPADATVTQNDTDKDVRTLVIELKGGAHAASASAMAKGKSGAKKAGRRSRGKRR
jgi:quercetin dioxygenase-like cupin family protein